MAHIGGGNGGGRCTWELCVAHIGGAPGDEASRTEVISRSVESENINASHHDLSRCEPNIFSDVTNQLCRNIHVAHCDARI